MKKNEKAAARLTVFRAPEMTKRGCRRICKWLIRQAAQLEANAPLYGKTYTARYIYTDK